MNGKAPTAGTRFGSYEITAKLAEGGMGEIYRARDTKLGRAVAIKVLPPHLAADADALARFEREAQAVATLSHPNIMTIFEFGREDQVAFAVMELLEGETLGQRLADGALPARKALELAAQMAQGLAAAHAKNIAHRDLKPDNLFITRDGQVKILDFGLARQLQLRDSESQLIAAPTRAPGTAAGVVLGTVGYMAPEQVRGEPADHRSDIFALGVVLYEMLTGRRAFAKSSAVETMSAILNEDPPELEALGEMHSPALPRLLEHCIEKRPDDRFQSARDLAFDLQSLASGGFAAVRPASGLTAAPAAGRRRRANGVLVAAGSAALGAGLGALATFALVDRAAGPTSHPGFRQLTRLPGGEGKPSIAPDGGSFVYVKSDGEDLDLFTQRIDGTTSIALTADCEQDDYDPAFSPDGRWIAYRSECGAGIFVMGATGESRRRVSDFGYWPAWSPDGRELAVVTERLDTPTSRNSTSHLWAVRVDTGKRRHLSEHDAMAPTWSHDGRRVAFWGLRGETFQRDLWSVAADGSQKAEATAHSIVDDLALDWAALYSRDGRWLYFASSRGGTLNLWRIALDADGARLSEPEPITTPSSSAGPFELSADGRRLVFVDRNMKTEIMGARFDLERLELAGAPEPLFSGSFELREQKLSPAGDWILFTNEDPPQQLHLVRPDGTGYRQLTTTGERNRQGEFSPAGDWIVFQTMSGDSSLAVIRPDGGGWQAVPVGRGVSTPRWSPDGSRIAVFDNSRGGRLLDVRAGFDQPVVTELPPVADGLIFWPISWSSDGALLAGRANRAGQNESIVVWSIASGDYRLLERTSAARENFNMVFLDQRHLLTTDDRALWLRDLAGGELKRIYTCAPGLRIDSLAGTHDGRFITWIERSDESDIWLLTLEEAGATSSATGVGG